MQETQNTKRPSPLMQELTEVEEGRHIDMEHQCITFNTNTWTYTNKKPGKTWGYRLGTVSSKCHWGFTAGFEGRPTSQLSHKFPRKTYNVNKNVPA